MDYMLKDMTPNLPFRFFEQIARIPRPSGHEEGIADYLCTFAAQNGLFCYRDAKNNVLIKKPASAGREGEAPLLLQAHTDMVAEKNANVTHDFLRDPIRLVREGDLLRADGTTLGADDGAGVAMMLALLCEAPSHPALECLFTTSEEVGLEGAAAFDYSKISARRLVNLDGNEENVIVTGCCGGLRTDVRMSITTETVKGEGLLLRVSGLCGGHSGEDIDKGRGNALTLMAEWLSALFGKITFHISSLCGGDKDNAIPRECTAEILPGELDTAQALLIARAKELKPLCTASEDAALTFTVERVEVTQAISVQETEQALYLLSSRGGVLARRADGTPHTSRNIASVRTEEGQMRLTVSTRSYEAGEIEKWRHEMESRATNVGAEVAHRGAYPGWESAPDSALADCWKAAMRAISGKEPQTVVIHAGLECGLISDHLPGLIAISMGPNAKYLHTPAECMELSSFSRFYRALLLLLQNC